MTVRKIFALVLGLLIGQAFAQSAYADDGDRLLRIDHYVTVKSTVPAIAGQTTAIYVREVVRAGTALRNRASDNPVVLFVHGAGTPGAVAFDVPYQDYSWMGYLAQAGFDVFAIDMTGYGRSTRPNAMNDPCNLSAEQQTALRPDVEPCAPLDGRDKPGHDGRGDAKGPESAVGGVLSIISFRAMDEFP